MKDGRIIGVNANIINNMESLTAYLNRRINAVLGCGLWENVVIDYIIVTEDTNNQISTNGLVLEAKVVYNPVPGVNHYTYRIDKQLGDGGPGRQRHIHIYYNGNEMFAINVDATAHDGYHKVKIPDEVVPFLVDKGFKVPDNHVIEMINTPSDDKELLCESQEYEAMTKLALDVCGAIRKASVITIIEGNVETFQVKAHSKVVGKYQHVNQLEDVPQCHIHEIKQMLIDYLKDIGKFGGTFEIYDDKLITPHRLFVAWNNQY